jgi:hypothetical protein
VRFGEGQDGPARAKILEQLGRYADLPARGIHEHEEVCLHDLAQGLVIGNMTDKLHDVL